MSGVGEVLSAKNREDLAGFIRQSVLPATCRTYDGHWRLWLEFLSNQTGITDPFLRDIPDGKKPSVVSLFLFTRYKAGLRGKGATAVTAGLRMRFAQELQSTAFLESAIISTARNACKLNPTELRARKDTGASTTVKLPICESILNDIRVRLWEGRDWSRIGMTSRMTYLGCVWGFDQSARISEYTAPERGSVDHCIRVDDLTFYIQTPNRVVHSLGSSLAMDLSSTLEGSRTLGRVIECRAQGASSKAKAVVKAKLIGRRSEEESQFLDDLVVFLTKSGARGSDELFSYRQGSGAKTVLKGRTVRNEIKDACEMRGLDPIFFSSHSIRKGAITHMRASGATEDDRRDRGNYAPGSQVMNQTYDYATGLGPLAANSLSGGRKPTIVDVQRLIPATRNRSL